MTARNVNEMLLTHFRSVLRDRDLWRVLDAWRAAERRLVDVRDSRERAVVQAEIECLRKEHQRLFDQQVAENFPRSSDRAQLDWG